MRGELEFINYSSFLIDFLKTEHIFQIATYIPSTCVPLLYQSIRAGKINHFGFQNAPNFVKPLVLALFLARNQKSTKDELA